MIRLDQARGRDLDQLAEAFGLQRKRRRWWIFREWDRTLRGRLLLILKTRREQP